MAKRYFLWSYSNEANFRVSQIKGLLGFPIGNDYSCTKAMDLSPDDIVLIRDSREKNYLKFFGSCVITGTPYVVNPNNEIWPDEIQLKQVLYPIRVIADFYKTQIPNLHKIDWDDLLAFRWTNQKGYLMGKVGISLLISKGNFVEGRRADQLTELLFK